MRKGIKQASAIFAILALAAMSVVVADQESTTVTFVIPSNIDHSISYGGSCSSANFFFVETDGTLDGTQDYLNASSDSQGANTCQNSTNSSITIHNAGSSLINVTLNMTAAYTAGTEIKVANGSGGWEAICTGTVAEATCDEVPAATAGIIVAWNIPAQNGHRDIWLWGNMSNFNSGAEGSSAQTLQSTAQSGAS